MLVTSLPSIPSKNPISYKFVYQQAPVAPKNFTATANTQTVSMFGFPANYVICGVQIRPLIKFVGGALTSVTIQIGTASNPNVFAPAFELTQPISLSSFQTTSSLVQTTTGTDTVIATFTSTGGFINSITSGMLEITVQIRPI